MDLQGRVAVVTGGASGIGRACADALDKAGARAVTWDLKEGADVVCDVSDPEAVAAAIAWTRAHVGDPSLLVAAAGVSAAGPILDIDPAEWDRTFAVNTRGVMLAIQAVARVVRERGGDGSFVAVSSVNGVVADPGVAAYGASKAAVFQLVRVAARELGPLGIRVNAVGPGPTATPMLEPLLANPEFRREVVERSALKALGTPELVAEAVVGLMQMSWVTGQAVMVDGGTSLNTGRSSWNSAPR